MSQGTALTIADLDQWFPPCGPCAFCGFHDQRHRVWAAIMDRAAAGETAAELALDYGVPVAAIEAVLSVRPYEHEPELEGLS